MNIVGRGPALVFPVLALAAALLGPALVPPGEAGAAAPDPEDPETGEELYMAACANCHGADGTGTAQSQLGFETPLPDFTDCNFATREPDADWAAVAHDGGPVRGFAQHMPAFGSLLSMEQIQRILDHVRSFCGSEWPRGELNLPRPLVTEKAYPEDEAVWTTSAATEGPGSVSNEIVYERRFGARNQIEIVVPFGFRERVRAGADGAEASDWTGGLGDMAVGVKRDVYHSLESGSILSLAGEVILPTGDEDDGFGAGTTIFEPFVAFGQLLPADGFLHLQGGLELPADTDRAGEEGFWRAALGRTFASGRNGFGRAWSPMVEVLGSREFEGGATTHWDLLPQVQVTLNTRQHVMANVGVRIPLDDTGSRDTEVLVYLLWDWFDGGFLAGW